MEGHRGRGAEKGPGLGLDSRVSFRRGQVLARPDTWEAKVRDSLGQRKEPKLA